MALEGARRLAEEFAAAREVAGPMAIAEEPILPDVMKAAGEAVQEGSRDVPSGRWSLHPDGYYVRYLPRGYSYTVTQIWVPEGSPAIGREYDPATHIATPGNPARQRLIQSGRVHDH